MANTKISALPANNNPTGNEELVYALNNANGKMSLSTMKTFANTWQQAELVSGVNIKTINNTSILWSGNIDVSWGGWGGFEPTELWGDANIWELSEWAYVTEYDLYYKTGEKVLAAWGLSTKKQMLFVTEDEVSWEKWFFVYSVGSSDVWYASYWYSKSSSVGRCYQLWDRDWSLKRYEEPQYAIDRIWSDVINQIATEVYWTQTLNISTVMPPYVWITHTILINSVQAWSTYSIALWTWVTNPFNITLPNGSNKKCLITLLATSSTTAIVTSCTIAS